MSEKEYTLDLRDVLNDINYAKTGNFINDDNEKHYLPFVINMCLARTIDSLYHAQELNMYGKITKQEHYKYLVHSLPKKKRFGTKIERKKDELIPLIQEYYNGCSEMKAKEIKKILSPENIEYIKMYLDKGGAEKTVKIKKESKKKKSL